MPKARCYSSLNHRAVFFAESRLLLPPRAQDPGLCLRLGTGLLTLQKSALGFICVPQILQSQLPERGLLFLPDLYPGEQVSRFIGQINERPGRPHVVFVSGHCDFSKRCFSSLSVQRLEQTGARNSSGTTRSAHTTASTLPGKMRLSLPGPSGQRCSYVPRKCWTPWDGALGPP